MMEFWFRWASKTVITYVSLLGIYIAMLLCILPVASDAFEIRDECHSDSGSKDWVIIGASYAKDWPIESIPGFEAINRGVGGNRSFEMQARFQTDVLDAKPDAVLIWGFINDLHASSPEKMEDAKSLVRQSYTEMVEEGKRQGVLVLVATEVTLSEPAGIRNWLAGIAGSLTGKKSYQEGINKNVLELNLWLRSFAKSRNVPVLDFQRVLSDADGWRRSEYTKPDGSHLTSVAYAELSRYTKEKIELFCRID